MLQVQEEENSSSFHVHDMRAFVFESCPDAAIAVHSMRSQDHFAVHRASGGTIRVLFLNSPSHGMNSSAVADAAVAAAALNCIHEPGCGEQLYREKRRQEGRERKEERKKERKKEQG